MVMNSESPKPLRRPQPDVKTLMKKSKEDVGIVIDVADMHDFVNGWRAKDDASLEENTFSPQRKRRRTKEIAAVNKELTKECDSTTDDIVTCPKEIEQSSSGISSNRTDTKDPADGLHQDSMPQNAEHEQDEKGRCLLQDHAEKNSLNCISTFRGVSIRRETQLAMEQGLSSGKWYFKESMRTDIQKFAPHEGVQEMPEDAEEDDLIRLMCSEVLRRCPDEDLSEHGWTLALIDADSDESVEGVVDDNGGRVNSKSCASVSVSPGINRRRPRDNSKSSSAVSMECDRRLNSKSCASISLEPSSSYDPPPGLKDPS